MVPASGFVIGCLILIYIGLLFRALEAAVRIVVSRSRGIEAGRRGARHRAAGTSGGGISVGAVRRQAPRRGKTMIVGAARARWALEGFRIQRRRHVKRRRRGQHLGLRLGNPDSWDEAWRPWTKEADVAVPFIDPAVPVDDMVGLPMRGSAAAVLRGHIKTAVGAGSSTSFSVSWEEGSNEPPLLQLPSPYWPAV